MVFFEFEALEHFESEAQMFILMLLLSILLRTMQKIVRGVQDGLWWLHGISGRLAQVELRLLTSPSSALVSFSKFQQLRLRNGPI